MDPNLLARLERIAGAGIQLLPTPEVPTHFVFEREGCVVLVERREAGFGPVGSPGLLVEQGGFAALVEREGRQWFVWKGGEREASPAEASAARRLFTELKTILG
jgi:hypothetical protein